MDFASARRRRRVCETCVVVRREGNSWQEELQLWFNGRILSETANRWVGNFLSVHRVRPATEDEDEGADEDLASDEEVVLEEADMADVLKNARRRT